MAQLLPLLKTRSMSPSRRLRAVSAALTGVHCAGGTALAEPGANMRPGATAACADVLASDVLTISRLQSGTFTPVPEVIAIRSTLKALTAQVSTSS